MNKLKKHRKVWKEKKILRHIYGNWYKKINKDLSHGKTVELGSGIGSFKDFNSDVITSDYQNQPWLDMSFDAHAMPFKKSSVSNLVLLDVLHHLENPIGFLKEAVRVLRKGGRVIMLEPYPSLFSLPFYRIFHPEPFIFNTDYFLKNNVSNSKKPWDSNQAIPYLIFFRDNKRFQKKFKKDFKILKVEKLSFILYPLSGGFENRSLIPEFSIPVFNFLEKLLQPFKSLLAFRCYIVLEKH